MKLTVEMTLTITPEELEGGYVRYTSDEMPGFSLLCEPKESPLPLLSEAMEQFMPPMFAAMMRGKVTLKGLRIISTAGALFKGAPGPIKMEADLAHV